MQNSLNNRAFEIFCIGFHWSLGKRRSNNPHNFKDPKSFSSDLLLWVKWRFDSKNEQIIIFAHSYSLIVNWYHRWTIQSGLYWYWSYFWKWPIPKYYQIKTCDYKGLEWKIKRFQDIKRKFCPKKILFEAKKKKKKKGLIGTMILSLNPIYMLSQEQNIQTKFNIQRSNIQIGIVLPNFHPCQQVSDVAYSVHCTAST
jgi:hypothetical protein